MAISRGVGSVIIDGVARRARRVRVGSSSANMDRSEFGSSLVATGATVGFFEAVDVVDFAADVLLDVDLVLLVREVVDFLADEDELVELFAPVVVFPPVDVFAFEVDELLLPLPRSRWTLFVTESTCFCIGPSSPVSWLPISFASATVFSNSPVSSDVMFRKSL
jgi:hypothetical protein